MRIFINECSFTRPVCNREELYNLLKQLVAVSQSSRRLSNNKPPRRHRDLKLKEVIPGITLEQYLHEIGKSSDPKIRTFKQLFLETFAKAPFLSFAHDKESSVVGNDAACLKGSCFDDALSSETGAAVISIAGTNKDLFIEVTSSIYGKRRVLNLCSTQQVDEYVWLYESNPKHEIPNDMVVKGETYSAMNLNEQDAQELLSNGIKCGKSIYNVKNGQWYKFHRHTANRFHGFPITIRTPYKDYSSASRIQERIGENLDGQVFSELL